MPTRTCLDCPAQFPAKGRRLRCQPCQRAHARRQQQSPERQNKNRARSAVYVALGAGTLQRRSCELVSPWRGTVCGQTPTHAHHEDYSKPLDVVWLCVACHGRRHRELKCNPPVPLVIDRPGLPQPDRDW